MELLTIKIFTLMNPLVETNNILNFKYLKNNFIYSLIKSPLAGFSLIEITIVMMIIGGILALALPRMSFNKMDNRKVFREFVITVKEVRNRAKLYNTTYRLCFRLDEKDQAYWLEVSTSPTLLNKEFLVKEREEKDRPFKDDKEAPQSPYRPDTSYFKKEKVLPKGYRFVSFESGPQDIILNEGTAYMHFFSQGMIEPSALQIEDPKKNIWTLVFNPLTGQADIIDGAKSLKDLSQ